MRRHGQDWRNLAVGLVGMLFVAGGLLLHHYRPGVYIDAPHLLWAMGLTLIVSRGIRQARRVFRAWRARRDREHRSQPSQVDQPKDDEEDLRYMGGGGI